MVTLNYSLSLLVSAPLLLANEETRLIESIDAINEKLKGRVMSLDTLEHSDNKKVSNIYILFMMA